MYRFPAPVWALNVSGITARTCPRKTNGAFPANSRTSAIEGGHIRRGQSWVTNKNREQPTKMMATQTRCILAFHTAPVYRKRNRSPVSKPYWPGNRTFGVPIHILPNRAAKGWRYLTVILRLFMPMHRKHTAKEELRLNPL